MADNDNKHSLDARLEELVEGAKQRTPEEREQLAREQASAAAVARRARQIHDACCDAGIDSDQIIAAAIIADRIDEVGNVLDGIRHGVADLEDRIAVAGRRD